MNLKEYKKLKEDISEIQKGLKILQDKELIEAGIGELKFEKMNVEHLKSIIDEVHTLGDKTVKMVIENGLERHVLDKIIHAKKLFNK